MLVGDSLRDIEAAHAAHCEAVLVRTGKPTVLSPDMENRVPVFDSLADAVEAFFRIELKVPC